ncbi:hypothetical protein OAG34_01700 [bacterium]|nr:hypothetical protein [bacterium]
MPIKTPTEHPLFDEREIDTITVTTVSETPTPRLPIPYVVPIVGVLLLCSVTFNFWVWASANTQRQRATAMEAKLLSKVGRTQTALQAKEADDATLEKQAAVMRAMLGGEGTLTQVQIDEFAQGESGDPQMDVLFRHYKLDMSLFAPDVPGLEKNDHSLSRYSKGNSD